MSNRWWLYSFGDDYAMVEATDPHAPKRGDDEQIYITVEDHESECAALRAEVEERNAERTEYARAYAAAESRLAAATELLGDIHEVVPAHLVTWFRRYSTFLATQLATPKKTNV